METELALNLLLAAKCILGICLAFSGIFGMFFLVAHHNDLKNPDKELKQIIIIAFVVFLSLEILGLWILYTVFY